MKYSSKCKSGEFINNPSNNRIDIERIILKLKKRKKTQNFHNYGKTASDIIFYTLQEEEEDDDFDLDDDDWKRKKRSVMSDSASTSRF